MIRSISIRGAMLMSVYPFNMKSNEQYDRPVNKLIKPLIEDEMGWDRVKRIFRLDETGLLTKELQSIIHVSTTGVIIGVIIGGVTDGKNTVDNFIANNEATRFESHFEAKKTLQREVFLSFVRKGAVMGRKLGLFCLMFSTLTTCITSYRGKLRVENYIFGGFITGFLNRINLGLRGSLVGGGLGGALGAISGSIIVSLLYITGTNIDEILQAQADWAATKNEAKDEKIRAYMAAREDIQEKKLFEQVQKTRSDDEKYKEWKKKVENPST